MSLSAPPTAVPPSGRWRRRGSGGADGARPRGGFSGDPVLPGRHRRRALLQFGGAALLALVVATAVGAVASSTVAEYEAVSDARLVTRVLTRNVIEPNLVDGLLTADPTAIRRLDDLVVGKITGQSVVRVKLWTPDGRIVYSDDHRLLGRQFALGESERAALRSGHVEAEVSDLGKPENALDRHLGQLLEVYLPVHTPGGQLLLFETYSQYSAVSNRAARIFWHLCVVTLGALLLLEAVQIPLALRTSRQLGQVQQDRELLLQKAIASARVERRRIAADLHDRVVQDLAAVSFQLGAAASGARTDPERSIAALQEGSAAVRGAIRSLRSLLVDIYPPSLHRTGLAAALHDLATPLSSAGLVVHVELPEDLAPTAAEAELVYRVAQEALRNAAAHAAAATVVVRITVTDTALVLEVEDDGRGFDPHGQRRRGHLGLELLQDLTADVDAVLTLDSAPGRGTRVRLEVPR
jgi:signal transduction histidine kinase